MPCELEPRLGHPARSSMEGWSVGPRIPTLRSPSIRRCGVLPQGSRDSRSSAFRRRSAMLLAGLSLTALLCIALLVPMGGSTPPAAAESSVSGTITDGAPEAIVVVGSSGVIASWWGGSGPRWTCAYIPIEAPFIDATGDGRGAFGVDPVEGMAYVLNCDDETGHLVSSRFVVYTPADPFGGVAVVTRVVTEARRRLQLDDPIPRSNPPGASLVGLPTWLWVEGPWSERTATASVGGLTATVHARPVGVDWDTGDGGHVLCDRGQAYDPARPARSQVSGCTHVFQRSSAQQPGGVHEIRAVLRWVVWWDSSTGEAGSLGVLSTSASTAIRVIEMQALVR